MPSTWLEQQGRRLDCGPYLSGAIEAKVRLDALPVAKAALRGVTAALVNAGRIKRMLVSDSGYGRPFLSSTDILLADLGYVSIISEGAVRDNPNLVIREGWILVTRSGTIGRMVFTRPDMDGLACSEDALRVIPEPSEIRPGYLYAFLSSRFGIPVVIGGTYGAIIQHIEPEHIADLPVPLAPETIQDEVHRLVTKAAEMRTVASAELRAVIREIEEAAGLPPLDIRYDSARPDTSLVKASAIRGRMDGLFHSNYHQAALGPLLRLPERQRTTAGQLASRVFQPPIFKRIRVEDPRYGVPFFGTSALMRVDPDASYLLSRRTSGLDDLFVDETTVLMPRSGQLAGIIGHAVLPYGDAIGGAVTEDAIRLFCPQKATAGYLFACLSSEYGRRQLKARAFGSSIPHLDEARVGGVVLPRLDDEQMESLGLRAFAVRTARHNAVMREREARTLVEHWIERQGAA